jgi:hypothetical protein
MGQAQLAQQIQRDFRFISQSVEISV